MQVRRAPPPPIGEGLASAADQALERGSRQARDDPARPQRRRAVELLDAALRLATAPPESHRTRLVRAQLSAVSGALATSTLRSKTRDSASCQARSFAVARLSAAQSVSCPATSDAPSRARLLPPATTCHTEPGETALPQAADGAATSTPPRSRSAPSSTEPRAGTEFAGRSSRTSTVRTPRLREFPLAWRLSR